MKKKIFFCIRKVTEESSRIWSWIRIPDPLVRGLDPDLHHIMSRIPNTGLQWVQRSSSFTCSARDHHCPCVQHSSSFMCSALIIVHVFNTHHRSCVQHSSSFMCSALIIIYVFSTHHRSCVQHSSSFMSWALVIVHVFSTHHRSSSFMCSARDHHCPWWAAAQVQHGGGPPVLHQHEHLPGQPGPLVLAEDQVCQTGLEKTRVFKKKTQPSGFFWVFLGFLGFFGFFWVFCPDERVVRVFFSFTNTFGCIQTLNYNHSY